MPTLTYDIGYYGYVTIGGIPILATDGSVTYQHNPIYTQGVWGANFKKNKNVHFAPDYPTLSVSFGFQLTNAQDLFVKLNQFANLNRNDGIEIGVYPNGKSGYNGTTYCQSISFSTSRDSLVTCSIQGKTAVFNSEIVNTGANASQLQTIAPKYTDVFPYYGSSLTFNETADDIVGSINKIKLNGLTSWNISQSSDVVFAKSCSYNVKKLSDLVADYVAIGLATVDGSFTNLWAQDTNLGHFGNNANFRAFYKNGQITIKTVDNKISRTIVFGDFQLTQNSSAVQTGTEMIETSCSFTAVGGTCLQIKTS